MYTDFIQNLNNTIYKVEQSELLTAPWPHMFVAEPINQNYRTFLEYADSVNIVHEHDVYGCRDEYVLTALDISTSDVRQFNKLMEKLFFAIAKKFGDEVSEAPVPCVTFWKDTDKLLINDIHTDQFFDPTYYTISAMIYLPKDDSQRRYGTKLFTYIGDDIHTDAMQDEGMTQPHMAHKDKEHNWKHEVTVPFMPNTMFITTNAQGSWHQAPTNIAPGDVRESVMIRWKCEY